MSGRKAVKSFCESDEDADAGGVVGPRRRGKSLWRKMKDSEFMIPFAGGGS